VLSDRFKARHPAARVWVGLSTALASVPAALTVLFTDSLAVAYVANFFFSVLSPMWVGCAATTVTDLVLPRMRALASSFYILMNTFVGLALGPWAIGRLSDAFAAAGMDAGAALRYGMLSALAILLLVAVSLLSATRHVARDEATRVERARALGEAT
jgi:MFS family permease